MNSGSGFATSGGPRVWMSHLFIVVHLVGEVYTRWSMDDSIRIEILDYCDSGEFIFIFVFFFLRRGLPLEFLLLPARGRG
jgi:hypothetical protein